MNKYILVSGCNGLIGNRLVQALLDKENHVLGLSLEPNTYIKHNNYKYYQIDLTQCLDVEMIFNKFNITRVIHLAALAHFRRGLDSSWSNYFRINTLCSKTIFHCAMIKSIPVFFASTTDVYGITKQEVTPDEPTKPIGNYALSKVLAEQALREICESSLYTIGRFAPIYSKEASWDIYKRYYLIYPNICFQIGSGKEYEFLNLDNVVEFIVNWIERPIIESNTVNLCDPKRHSTKSLIDCERNQGRAKYLVHIPAGLMNILESLIELTFGTDSYYSFMFSKLNNPISISRIKGNNI